MWQCAKIDKYEVYPHVALDDLNVDPHVADGPPDILTQVTLWVGQVVLIDGAAPL